jgi:glycosyltransferase involved in cell wall biosynthesis
LISAFYFQHFSFLLDMPRVSEQSSCDNPKVSVKMITYNHEKFIAQAIESVLMQETDFPVELVIGEDCSTDGTRRIVQAYAQKYPHVIRALLPEKNLGIAKNSDDVKAACRGKYIALLEGDDYWTLPQKLQKQVQLMDANPHYSMCGAKARILEIEKNGREKEIGVLQPKISRPYFELSDFLDNYFLHTNTLMLRNGLLQLPAWANKVKNRDEVVIALHAEKGPVGFLNEVVSVYRLHSGGIWSAMDVGKRFRLNRQTCDLLNAHFEGLFVKIIRRRECRMAMAVCQELLANGNVQEAKVIFWETVPRVKRFKPLAILIWGVTIYGNRYISAWHKFTQRVAVRTRIRRLTHFHLI